MGVLEHTSEQQLYVPPPRGSGTPDMYDISGVYGMLGERPDIPSADYGKEYLYEVTRVPNRWFMFGKPPEKTFVYQPELLAHAKLSPDLMHAFWRNTFSYAAGEALATVDDVMEVARGPLGTRRTIFEVTFETWDTKQWVPDFVGELHKLFMAHHPESVLRDDRGDQGGYPENPHYTEVRIGALGASTALLITRSRMATDRHGREVVARLVELAKPDADSVDDILAELSLIEQLRLEELWQRENATPDERAYLIAHADRRTMQYDHRSLLELIEKSRRAPEPSLWRKAARGLVGLLDRAADTSFVHFLSDVLPQQGKNR